MNSPPGKPIVTGQPISPLYANLQGQANQLSAADYRVLSIEFRRGLVNYYGANKGGRVLLALLLCEDTFDTNLLVGRADLVKWSLRMRWRARDLERLAWRELIKDLIVDFNPAQGTYQLRPDASVWWHPGSAGQNNLGAGQELPLVCERPLSDAQSDMARRAVLERTDAQRSDQSRCPTPAGPQSNQDWTAQWSKLKADLGVPQSSPEEQSEGAANSSRGRSELVAGGAANSSRTAGYSQKVPDTPLPEAQRTRRALYACNALIRDHAFNARATRGDPQSAWSWLKSIDSNGALEMRSNRGRWAELCQRDPDYVLGLKGALEAGVKKAERQGKQLQNPIRYLAAKIWDDRMFRSAK